MIASYLLDPSRQSHGLDALARHLGRDDHVQGGLRQARKQIGFDAVDVARATDYAA